MCYLPSARVFVFLLRFVYVFLSFFLSSVPTTDFPMHSFFLSSVPSTNFPFVVFYFFPISLWSFLPILLTISFVSFLLSFLPLFLVHFWQKVTSNNCESMNAKFSVKVSFDAIRGKCWSDVVPTMLHDTRKHFANARKSVAASSLRLSLREGLSENGLDLVAQNCNFGSLLYSCVDFGITPIASSKPVADDVEPGHVSTLELNFQKQIVRLARQL